MSAVTPSDGRLAGGMICVAATNPFGCGALASNWREKPGRLAGAASTARVHSSSVWYDLYDLSVPGRKSDVRVSFYGPGG